MAVLDGGRGPNHRQRTGDDRGQSLVEFALMVPLLLLLLLGGVDLGRAFYYQVTITNAAREGARAASLPTNSDTDIRSAAQGEVSSTILVPDYAIVINPSPSRISGQPVSVTVAYDFPALTPVIDTLLGHSPLHLSGSAATVVQ